LILTYQYTRAIKNRKKQKSNTRQHNSPTTFQTKSGLGSSLGGTVSTHPSPQTHSKASARKLEKPNGQSRRHWPNASDGNGGGSKQFGLRGSKAMQTTLGKALTIVHQAKDVQQNAAPSPMVLHKESLTTMQLSVLQGKEPKDGWTQDQINAIAPILAMIPCALPVGEDEDITFCLTRLSMLKRRTDDALVGKIRGRIYRMIFMEYPYQAVNDVVDQLARTDAWLPTEGQLRSLLDLWLHPDKALINRAYMIIHFGKRAAPERIPAQKKSLQPLDIANMPSELISLGLKAGILITVEGKVTEA
jgi:hypothetical protein